MNLIASVYLDRRTQSGRRKSIRSLAPIDVCMDVNMLRSLTLLLALAFRQLSQRVCEFVHFFHRYRFSIMIAFLLNRTIIYTHFNG